MPDLDPRHLETLLKKVRSESTAEPPDSLKPMNQLLMGFLTWMSSRNQAEAAYGRVVGGIIDMNDLRISQDHELIDLIGDDYPFVEMRVARLRESLYEIYLREHATEMLSIDDKGKKEQRAYLDTLPGMPPYVAAHITLVSYGGHAIPVDEKLVALLAREKVIDAEAHPADVEALLLRQIKADDNLTTHTALQQWEDASRLRVEPIFDLPESTAKVAKITKMLKKSSKKAPAKATLDGDESKEKKSGTKKPKAPRKSRAKPKE